MKAQIDNLTLTIGEKQITLTMEEAEALRAVLNEKLGRRDVTQMPVIIEKHAPVPMRVPWPREVRDRWMEREPGFPPNKIICSREGVMLTR